jgi:hypothetical protein
MTAPHRCAGCGTIGRPPLADPPEGDQRPVLKLVWTGNGPRLLCQCCEIFDAIDGGDQTALFGGAP